MKRRLARTVLATIGSSIVFEPPVALADNAIPIIPFDVLKKKDNLQDVKSGNANPPDNVSPVKKGGATTSKSGSEPELLDAAVKRTIKVEEGRNVLISISLGHPNRLEVPFENPKIVTTSTASIQVDGNVIYVSTRSKVPVTMFIMPESAEHPAISVSLIPKRIPPRDIELKFADDSTIPLMPASKEKAEQWEQTPYIDLIKKSMRALANKRIPDGYSLSRLREGMALPLCQQDGLKFDFASGEVVTGSRLRIYVGVIQNISNRVVEFKERSCATWGVAGVAAWPQVFLRPGDKTEVYVAVKANAWASKPSGKYRKPLVE